MSYTLLYYDSDDCNDCLIKLNYAVHTQLLISRKFVSQYTLYSLISVNYSVLSSVPLIIGLVLNRS